MEKTYIIYKIECKTQLEDGYVYVGSTSAFRRRKHEHKNLCGNETKPNYNLKLYQTIRANGGWDNWEMKPVEELTATKLQAHIREQYWIDHFKPVLNIIRACEDADIRKANNRIWYYSEEGKKYHKDYNKKWKELHREQINKNQQERRLADKIPVKQNYDTKEIN